MILIFACFLLNGFHFFFYLANLLPAVTAEEHPTIVNSSSPAEEHPKTVNSSSPEEHSNVVNSSSPAEHPNTVNISSPKEEPSQSPEIFGKNLLLLFIVNLLMLLGLSPDFAIYLKTCTSAEIPEHREIINIKSSFRPTFLPAIHILKKAYSCKG